MDLKEGPVDRDTYHPQVGFRISSGDDIDEFDGDFAREAEQDAESGDIDQDFPVTGDNSNQCVGTQGVANTGNAQDAVSLGLLGGDYDDLEDRRRWCFHRGGRQLGHVMRPAGQPGRFRYRLK